MKEFGKTVAQFRRDYIEEWVGHALDIGLDKIVEVWTQIPPGTTIVVASLTPEQQKAQQEQQARLAESLRENFAHVQEPERLLANLEALKLALRKTLAHGLQQGESPTEDENREACVWQVFLAHLWQLTLAHLWKFAGQLGGMEMRWASG